MFELGLQPSDFNTLFSSIDNEMNVSIARLRLHQ